MHVRAGPDAHRAGGPVLTHTWTWEPVGRPTGLEGAGGDPYKHVGAGPEAHRSEEVCGDPYMHMGAGPEAHRP